MKGKISICVFVFVFLVFGFGWAKESYAGTDGEAPLVKLWEQSYSPSDFNWLMDLAIDSNDNIIVTGFTGFFEAVETIKYDGNGEVLWTNKDPSLQIVCAIAVDSLNKIIVGASHPLTGYNIIKYLPDGATDWTKTYDEGGAKIVWSVACDGDDNIIVLGDTQPDQGWMALKYDNEGSMLWNNSFGCPEGRAGYPQSVVIDSNNNIILAGYGFYNSSSSTDMVIIKYDPEGNMFWSKPVVYDSGNYDYAQAVCVDKEDNIVVAGSRRDGEGNDHLYVRKYGPDGSFIWDVVEDSEISTAHAVAIDKNDRILVGGTKGEYRGSNYIVCYDTSGNKLWNLAYNPTNGTDEIYGLAIDSNNDIGVGGTATGTYLTTKYAYVQYDGDGDGLPDNFENSRCTDPFDADSDDDGIIDGAEDVNHNGVVDPGETDPCNIDTDGDGIQDGTELGITEPVSVPRRGPSPWNRYKCIHP